MRYRALATQFIKASRLTEVLSKFALIKISTPRAIFMYQLTIEVFGALVFIKLFRLGQPLEQYTRHRAHEPIRVGWAAGDIYQRGFDAAGLEKLTHADTL